MGKMLQSAKDDIAKLQDRAESRFLDHITKIEGKLADQKQLHMKELERFDGRQKETLSQIVGTMSKQFGNIAENTTDLKHAAPLKAAASDLGGYARKLSQLALISSGGSTGSVQGLICMACECDEGDGNDRNDHADAVLQVTEMLGVPDDTGGANGADELIEELIAMQTHVSSNSVRLAGGERPAFNRAGRMPRRPFETDAAGFKLSKVPLIDYDAFPADVKQLYAIRDDVQNAREYVTKCSERKCINCPEDSPNMPHREGQCPLMFATQPAAEAKLNKMRVARARQRVHEGMAQLKKGKAAPMLERP